MLEQDGKPIPHDEACVRWHQESGFLVSHTCTCAREHIYVQWCSQTYLLLLMKVSMKMSQVSH
jgi:hypothetical protein